MELNGRIQTKKAVSKKGSTYKAISVFIPTIDKSEKEFLIFPRNNSDWRLIGINPEDERFFQ